MEITPPGALQKGLYNDEYFLVKIVDGLACEIKSHYRPQLPTIEGNAAKMTRN